MKAPASDRSLRVVIAGGGGGVGLACAEALAARGAELILCDIDGTALTRAAERLGAFSRFCDAIEDNSVAIFAAEIADGFPSIDVLVNAAGRGYVRALAMMRMSRALMPLLRRGSGRRMVVNIAPAGGFVSSDGMFPYASSQRAFGRLADAMAEQVKGTSIEIVNITPQLLRGRLANAGPAHQLYQLQRVDEECTASEVASLVSGGRRLAPKSSPGQGRASGQN